MVPKMGHGKIWLGSEEKGSSKKHQNQPNENFVSGFARNMASEVMGQLPENVWELLL